MYKLVEMNFLYKIKNKIINEMNAHLNVGVAGAHVDVVAGVGDALAALARAALL